MTRYILSLLGLALFGCWSGALAIEITRSNPLAPDSYGTYGPGGDCKRSPRVSVDATGVYIVIGDKRGKVEPAEACFSCVGGARYEGIEFWVMPKAGKGYSTYFRFNADEKRGALKVEPTGEVPLGPNLRSVVAASPYRRCGPPAVAAPRG